MRVAARRRLQRTVSRSTLARLTRRRVGQDFFFWDKEFIWSDSEPKVYLVPTSMMNTREQRVRRLAALEARVTERDRLIEDWRAAAAAYETYEADRQDDTALQALMLAAQRVGLVVAGPGAEPPRIPLTGVIPPPDNAARYAMAMADKLEQVNVVARQEVDWVKAGGDLVSST